MKFSLNRLRQHAPFFIIAPLLIIALTWPTFHYTFFDLATYWLPQNHIDIHMKIWDAWYGKMLLSGQGQQFYFTDLLFYPDGLSLVFHNFSLPQMALWVALQTVLPSSNAFNLSYLLLAFCTMASAYVYLLYLLRDKWLSLFGAIVFGAGGFALARPHNPEISTLFTVPLALYFFHRAALEERGKFFAGAGLVLGLTAFVGMYSLVCLLLTLGFYIVYFAVSRWRQLRFWRGLALLCCVAAPLLFLRFGAMLADSAGLDAALSKEGSNERERDLIDYFINDKQPITKPLFASLFGPYHSSSRWVYLGYAPLFLAALALARRKQRRTALPWLALALFFLTLRLGSSLLVNGQPYENILLPKHYLQQLLPQIFQPVYRVSDFHTGFLFPFALLSCLGLRALLQSLPARWRRAGILLLLALVAFEYYQPPEPMVLPARVGFIEWLREQENQEIRLINLPLGRQYSKIYGSYQTRSGYAHAEGLAARTPPQAYKTIHGNLILKAWGEGIDIQCSPLMQDDYLAALAELSEVGFTHIALHRWGGLAEDLPAISASFEHVPPAHTGEYATLYRLPDLHASCDYAAGLLHPSAALLLQRLLPVTPMPKQSTAVLSLRPAASGTDADLPPALLADAENVHELHFASASAPAADALWHEWLAAKSEVLLVYDPEQTEAALLETYRGWLDKHLRVCGQLDEAEGARVEYYLREGFPCDLALAGQPLTVEYDNGIRLGNLVWEKEENRLQLYFLWQVLPGDAHKRPQAASLQLFDAAGARMLPPGDFVIGLEPLRQREIDISALPPGQYHLKLIVYDYESGRSTSGTVLASGASFARELEIGSFSH